VRETVIRLLVRKKFRNPILVEGLPGMGYVGRIAVEHMIEQLGAEKFAEIYSPSFPHHVAIEKSGIMRLLRNDLYWADCGRKHVIFWVGDAQPLTPEGHYDVVREVLDFAQKSGVRQVFTLGGLATGEYVVNTPRVVALGDPRLVARAKKHGAITDRLSGPIIGAAGLLVGLGKLRGMKGLCLLGETMGLIADPRAAKAVLHVLLPVLGLRLSFENLEEKAREIEEMMQKLKREVERRERAEKEELFYIG